MMQQNIQTPIIDSDISLRKATINDIDYIVEILIKAEKSISNNSPMQEFFGLNDVEYKELIKKILAEEIPGSEYFYENYYLVFVKNEFVGGIAVWIEGKGNNSSNFIKASLLSYHLGIKKWIEASSNLELFTSILHQRQAETLQIDAGYIVPKFQGRSFPLKIISYGINFYKEQFEKLKKVQVVSIIENTKGIKSLQKLGFEIVNKKQTDNQKLIKLISGTGFYQLELNLEKYINLKYGKK